MPLCKLLADLLRELASTRRMLERYPAGHGDYYRLLDVAVPGMYGPSADD